MREDRGDSPGFRTRINNPGKDELGHHIVDIELEAHLSGQDINGFLDIQFLSRKTRFTMTCPLSVLLRSFQGEQARPDHRAGTPP